MGQYLENETIFTNFCLKAFIKMGLENPVLTFVCWDPVGLITGWITKPIR